MTSRYNMYAAPNKCKKVLYIKTVLNFYIFCKWKYDSIVSGFLDIANTLILNHFVLNVQKKNLNWYFWRSSKEFWQTNLTIYETTQIDNVDLFLFFVSTALNFVFCSVHNENIFLLQNTGLA